MHFFISSMLNDEIESDGFGKRGSMLLMAGMAGMALRSSSMRMNWLMNWISMKRKQLQKENMQ